MSRSVIGWSRSTVVGMGWAAVLLGIVWLGIAAGVTLWALRARHDRTVDLRSRPEGLLLVERIDSVDLAARDDLGDPTGA